MAIFRRFHLTITGSLFLIAFLFYAAGLGFGAIVFSILGAIVEIAAWVAMFVEAPEQPRKGTEE